MNRKWCRWHTKEKVGPKIDPCGTPELIKKTEDDGPSSTTLI